MAIMGTPQKPIIFFDGICGLCNKFIDFVMRHDLGGKFMFAALQGKAAEKMLGRQPVAADPQSIVLWDQGKICRSSTAVVRIISQFGGVWKLSGLLLLIPKFLRDPFYFYIARNRYRWFGKRESCRLPSEGERNRFLD